MRKKDNKLFSKIVMIFFLVMIILGFTIPGFLHSPLQGESTHNQNQAEPKLCQTDADCTLSCGDSNVPVLCTQNLCMQNSCEEGSYFTYREEPASFTLNIIVNQEPLNYELYGNTQNSFITAQQNQINLHTRGLYLQQILEKFQMGFTEQCFVTPLQNYCGQQGEELTFTVNGEESTEFANYVPQENDVIEIIVA